MAIDLVVYFAIVLKKNMKVWEKIIFLIIMFVICFFICASCFITLGNEYIYDNVLFAVMALLYVLMTVVMVTIKKLKTWHKVAILAIYTLISFYFPVGTRYYDVRYESGGDGAAISWAETKVRKINIYNVRAGEYEWR